MLKGDQSLGQYDLPDAKKTAFIDWSVIGITGVNWVDFIISAHLYWFKAHLYNNGFLRDRTRQYI